MREDNQNRRFSESRQVLSKVVVFTESAIKKKNKLSGANKIYISRYQIFGYVFLISRCEHVSLCVSVYIFHN